jgi:hypothetical protein
MAFVTISVATSVASSEMREYPHFFSRRFMSVRVNPGAAADAGMHIRISSVMAAAVSLIFL